MNSFYNHYYRHYTPYIPKPFDNNKDQSNINNFSKDSNKDNNKKNNNYEQKKSRYNSFGPIHFKNPIFSDIEEPIFEIFGIELYLDDIIILGLLFFLYKEGVQDEMLFITLILLLVS